MIKFTSVIPGPVSGMFASRACMLKEGDPKGRTRIEVIVDETLERAEKDTATARFVSEMIQGRAAQTLTEEQVILQLAQMPRERLAALSSLPIHEVRAIMGVDEPSEAESVEIKNE